MVVHFRLERPEELGFVPELGRLNACRRHPDPRARTRSNYLRLVRGWAFDSDGREAAVLKGWVESRFGLLARYHRGCLHDPASEAQARYQEARAAGLYGPMRWRPSSTFYIPMPNTSCTSRTRTAATSPCTGASTGWMPMSSWGRARRDRQWSCSTT
jgi:hypothetical protein